MNWAHFAFLKKEFFSIPQQVDLPRNLLNPVSPKTSAQHIRAQPGREARAVFGLMNYRTLRRADLRFAPVLTGRSRGGTEKPRSVCAGPGEPQLSPAGGKDQAWSTEL